MFNCMITFNFLRILRRRNKAANEVDFSRSLKLMEWLLQNVGALGGVESLELSARSGIYIRCLPLSCRTRCKHRWSAAASPLTVTRRSSMVSSNWDTEEPAGSAALLNPLWHFTNATCTHLLSKKSHSPKRKAAVSLQCRQRSFFNCQVSTQHVSLQFHCFQSTGFLSGYMFYVNYSIIFWKKMVHFTMQVNRSQFHSLTLQIENRKRK